MNARAKFLKTLVKKFQIDLLMVKDNGPHGYWVIVKHKKHVGYLDSAKLCVMYNVDDIAKLRKEHPESLGTPPTDKL
jgi:hypothetical protein